MAFVLDNDFDQIENGAIFSPLDMAEVPEEIIKEQARLTLELAARAPDTIIPDYMRTVAINEFPNHDYVTRSVLMSKIDPALGDLKLSYKNFKSWDNAMRLWQNTMDQLVEIYGNEEWVEVSIAEGIIPAILPPRPVLKPTKKNRKILKTGIIPIEFVDYFSDDEMVELIRKSVPIPKEDIEKSADEYTFSIKKLPKKERKVWKAIEERRLFGYRKANRYKSTGVGDDSLDAIKNFMQSGNYSKFNEQGETYENMAIDDIVRDIEYYDGWDETVVEHILGGNPISWKNGKLIHNTEAEATEVLEYMMEQGIIPPLEAVLSDKRLSVRSIEMITGELAAMTSEDGPMTKKERKILKKMKKKMKKQDRKRAEKKARADQILSDALANPFTTFRDANGDAMSFGDRLRDW